MYYLLARDKDFEMWDRTFLGDIENTVRHLEVIHCIDSVLSVEMIIVFVHQLLNMLSCFISTF